MNFPIISKTSRIFTTLTQKTKTKSFFSPKKGKKLSLKKKKGFFVVGIGIAACLG